jgi:hypothetical protein
MNSAKGDPAEEALAVLLDALAPMLLLLDVTPTRLDQIARMSFVKAGAAKAKMRSTGRPHLAKIASLTGLSRTEVKRIVTANYKVGRREDGALPRALRVLAAWRSSKIYVRNGRPRPLKITGAAPSFESLCKDYSGDIPHRVILDELEGRRQVVLTKRRAWASVAAKPEKRTNNQRDLSTLIFAAGFMSDAVRSESVLLRRRERILASKEIPDAYVEKAIAERVTKLLDHIPDSFLVRRTSSKRRGLVNVYALVSKTKRGS